MEFFVNAEATHERGITSSDLTSLQLMQKELSV